MSIYRIALVLTSFTVLALAGCDPGSKSVTATDTDVGSDCVGEGENAGDGQCCEGLSVDFSNTCLPCIPEGQSPGVDGPGCCEGLVTSDPEEWICVEPEEGADSGTDSGGECAAVEESCAGADCCEGLGCNPADQCVPCTPLAQSDADGGGCCEGLVTNEEGLCIEPLDCAAVAENCAETPCCEGLGCNFAVECVPCTEEGQSDVDGGGCCEGLMRDDEGICVAASACVDLGESCVGASCCEGLTCDGESSSCVE